MEQSRVIGYVVSVNGFRLKVDLSTEAKSSSRATPDGVQRAVAINSFLTFDLGAGTHAIGILSDLEARETYDPLRDEELSLELTKPRRIAFVQLLRTVRQLEQENWQFDTGITILPTLDTPAEIASPDVLDGIFAQPPLRNKPQDCKDKKFDHSVEIGHLTGNENSKVKASFNDLFSRPLAIVGNTGSGKSYTVASLLRGVIENDDIDTAGGSDPHIFILDINGEYANSFLSEKESQYSREPNEVYVNGKKFSVPIWLMNSEEICEWLSASEQTQQPVLKAWWAYLKGSSYGSASVKEDSMNKVLSLIRLTYSSIELKKKLAWERCFIIEDLLSNTDISSDNIKAVKDCIVKEGEDPNNFFGNLVINPRNFYKKLRALKNEIEEKISKNSLSSEVLQSGDTPAYFSTTSLNNTATLVTAASQEDTPQIEQHLTTLRMRLKTRLADRRWSVFTNYDNFGITDVDKWFRSLGFGKKGQKVTVFDLSMLSHEVLPFICAIIGRVLLEAREKLNASQRYSNPWVLVLEEAHNYAKPMGYNEDRGKGLSRQAFERVAKEGRKFGLSLIVASQRPSEISPTIISQCANFFSHRLQNPDDIEHFRRIIPKQAQRLLDQVTVLASGEAIVFGSAVHVPSRVKIAKPSQEPWSSTAAPFYEWIQGENFPLNAVIKHWGLANVASEENTSLEEGESSP